MNSMGKKKPPPKPSHPGTDAGVIIPWRRPWLYPKQEAAVFAPQRFAVVEASTKSGKTLSCLIWILEQAMLGQRGRNYWWVAPVNTQAVMAFDRMKLSIRPATAYTAQEKPPRLTLPNGTRIWFKSADEPDSLFGEDVYAAVVDEASRCKQESWIALLTTLSATAGPVRVIGNVKGRKNWAYKLGRRAEAGEPDMAYAKLTAQDAIDAGIMPSHMPEEVQRAGIPYAAFRQLYYAEASDDEGQPFKPEAVKACVVPSLSDQPAVVWGWDIAKSVDYTVGIALDAAGAVCGFHRYQRSWEDTVRHMLAVSTAPALIDSTGVGDPVLERLQALAPGRFRGFKFSSQSKQQLMEGLAVAIEHQQLRIPEGPLVSELLAFEYQYSRTGVCYSAPEGMHDDCVCALALAVQQWAHQRPALTFLGNETVTNSQAEQDAAETARLQAAAEEFQMSLRSSGGIYWPGGH